MSNWWKAIEGNVSGIKCDQCDYRDMSIPFKKYKSYLNKPCPKCGAVLLTNFDYKYCVMLMRITFVVNVIWFPIHAVKMIFSKTYRDNKRSFRTQVELDGSGKVKIS